MGDDLLHLVPGHVYIPALVRLEQQGRIKGAWGKMESNREAKFYAVTKAGEKALTEETRRWRQMSGLVEKLLLRKELESCGPTIFFVPLVSLRGEDPQLEHARRVNLDRAGNLPNFVADEIAVR